MTFDATKNTGQKTSKTGIFVFSASLKNVPAYLLLTLCSAMVCFLFAQRAGAEETVILSPIVVTAKSAGNENQTGDANPSMVPGFYHKINRQEFEGKVADLSEVIEKEAGVQVRQSGGLGSFSSVSLRGSSAEQVMIYADGVLLNDGAGGGVDLSTVSLADVASIEIYRGMSPIQFDRASIGGAVNIRTIRTTPGLKTTVSAGYGSFDTRKFAGFINHRPQKGAGKWDYLISGDYLSADNDFRFKNDNGTPENPDDDRWENRHNAEVDQFNLLTRMGLDVGSDTRLDMINKFFSKDQGLPSWNNRAETETDFSTDQNISTLKWVADDVSPFHLNTCSRIDYLFKTETYDDSKGHVGLGRQKNEYDTRRLSGKSFVEYQGENHLLQCSAGGSLETYAAKELFSRKTTTQTRRISVTTGLQGTIFLMDQRLQITPGLRFLQVRDHLEKAADDKGNPVEGEELSDGYLMPQIGARFQFNPDVTVKANISRYHRIPTFYELFGDRGIFLGNPELKPEKGINADAGFEIQKPTDWGLLNKWSGYGVIFVSRIDDLISRTYDARGIGKSDNISKADIYGVECNLNLEVNDYVSLTGQYTWQKTENKSAVRAFNGNRLPGKFAHSWLAKARFSFKNMLLGIAYVCENDMYYDTANLLPAKTKTEINADLSWAWKEMVFALEAKNITNDNYEDYNGYPQPGRSYVCSLKYSL